MDARVQPDLKGRPGNLQVSTDETQKTVESAGKQKLRTAANALRNMSVAEKAKMLKTGEMPSSPKAPPATKMRAAANAVRNMSVAEKAKMLKATGSSTRDFGSIASPEILAETPDGKVEIIPKTENVWEWSRPYIVHPEGQLFLRWNVALVVLLLYIAIVVPLQMGFRLSPAGAWQIWEYCVDVFFIFDFVFNFFNGYTDGEGRIVLTLPQTGKNYASSPWIVIDFVTSIPYDWFVPRGGGGNTKMLKTLKAMKAAKILRLNRLMRGNPLEDNLIFPWLLTTGVCRQHA